MPGYVYNSGEAIGTALLALLSAKVLWPGWLAKGQPEHEVPGVFGLKAEISSSSGSRCTCSTLQLLSDISQEDGLIEFEISVTKVDLVVTQHALAE